MSGTRIWCRHCQKKYPDWRWDFCPEHPSTELTEVPESTGQAAEPDPDERHSTCWSCGAWSTHADNDTCPECHESLVRPALVIDFPTGSVVLRDHSSSAVLGRAGDHGRIFAGYPNVSGRHALISVDEAGEAWLTPFPEAPNGTFVNDEEIQVRTAITPSDRVRFGTDQQPRPGPVSERIRQPFRER